KAQTDEFANQVLDRFRNPHIKHQWIAITVQFSAKLKMRVVPLLLHHYQKNEKVPALMALGFAAYIAFMQVKTEENGKYFGELNDKTYPVNDDQASYFYQYKNSISAETWIHTVLSSTELWGTNLTLLPGFETAVQQDYQMIMAEGSLVAMGN
ncbi:MAG: altronate oxidoreductase, partial [Sphingobacteriaceae bacterium]